MPDIINIQPEYMKLELLSILFDLNNKL
jgi:hypothetical protein